MINRFRKIKLLLVAKHSGKGSLAEDDGILRPVAGERLRIVEEREVIWIF